MPEGKKYYWLKLKRDFFKRHDIQIVESMPNGKDYVLFYLKLLAESIDHEGLLRFNDLIPYSEQMLATITNTNVDIVRSAITLLKQLDLIEVLDDQTIFVKDTAKMLGEGTSTNRVRQFRDGKKQLLLGDEYGLGCAYCGAESTEVDHIIPTSKGGENKTTNAVPACRPCNSRKYQKDVSEFLNDERKRINLDSVLQNEKIMAVVEFDNDKFTMKRYMVVTETENGTEIEIEKEIDKELEVVTKRKRFSAPTLEQVSQYCQERSNKVSPQKFINHYESNGWKVGKNKMVDWQAAVRNWEQNSDSVTKYAPKKPSNIGNFEGREYTKEFLDSFYEDVVPKETT